MSYNKLGFIKGQTLKAEHLNHMEEGIANVSWNDLTDKPFGESVSYGDTLSINLDALSSEDVVMDTSGWNIKVSDATPTLNEFVNGVIIQNTENGQYNVLYDEILYQNENSPFDDMVIFEMFVVIPSDNFTMNFDGGEMVFPEKGTYILAEAAAGMAGILDVTIPGYNGFETTVTKKIDEKYLPAVGVTKFYIVHNGDSGDNYLYTSADGSEETRAHSKDIDAAVSRGTIVLYVVSWDGGIECITYPRYISRGTSGYFISADGDGGTQLGCMTSDFDAGES